MIFIEAKNYTPVAEQRPIDLIIIHTMEAPEKPGTALAVARWFAGSTAPRASAHYCVDDRDTIQCVLERDVAWGAPGANANGIHIEHAGYAAQSHADWSDAYSQAMLRRSAELCARLCQVHAVPVVRLGAAELLGGARGISGHAHVSEAFKRSTHWDPGGNFPWEDYLGLVRAAMEVGS